ncbi:COG4648 family protein [Methylomarinum vadi]|uniref:COG4648 family protein n=1 Tax=Methylomarinum vadi TaxID=438855 RepID=UPI0004DF46BB|nr:membrane protein [Methylomarinum vadi]
MGRLVNGVIGVFTLLYPVAVYYGIHYVQPWQIAAVLALLLLGRQLNKPAVDRGGRWLFIAVLLYCGFAVWNNNLATLRFYPALINLGLLAIFAASLYFPPPIIERLARLQHPNLPPKGVRYTRRVTQVWCGFFLMNGALAFATAVWGSFAFWSLYNGLVAYLLMGLLLVGEYWIRIRTQEHVR